MVLGVVAFFVMLGFGVVVPVLPTYVRSFGVDFTAVGAVVAAFALMRLVTNPFVGPLVDRLGERVVLATGIGIVAVSSALVGVASDYGQLLLLRGTGGIGSAMFTVSAMTLLLRTAPAERRGRSLGFYQGGFLLGGMAGPAVGGVLTAISLTAPFFFYAGTLAIAGLVGLMLLAKPERGGTASAAANARTLREVVRDRRYQSAVLANFALGWSAMGVRATLVPVLVVEGLGGQPAWTGVAFAIAAVVQTMALAPAGRFVDTVGRRPALIGGFATAALAMLAMPFVSELWLLVVLLCVYGAAAAFMGTAPGALVGDASGGRGGTPVAVFQAASDLGGVLGPLLAGALADAASPSAAFASAFALLALTALAGVRLPRR